MSDNYKFTLDAKYLKKAKDELNENDSDRLAAVEAFRTWINEQKHVKIPTDTLNLLKILRHSKFSQVKARETCENWAAFSVKHSKIIHGIDTSDLTFMEIVKTGQMLILPGYDDQGRKVMLFRFNVLPISVAMKKYGVTDIIRSWNYFQCLFYDEMTQINGVVFVIDMTGISLGEIAKMGDSTIKEYEKDSLKAMIGRMKAFHYYNCGTVFEAFFAFYKTIMKKKLIDRVKVHDTLESVYEYVPKRMFPTEYLPDDYTGQSAGSIKDLIKSGEEMLRSPACSNYMKTVFNKNNFFYDEKLKEKTNEPVQHFRKLNID